MLALVVIASSTSTTSHHHHMLSVQRVLPTLFLYLSLIGNRKEEQNRNEQVGIIMENAQVELIHIKLERIK